ncbi:MAG: hypothetical protein U1D55_10705 [Phycisphaerae bacterium]
MQNFADSALACERLRQAAQLNLEDPIRQGSTLVFGGAGQLVMTGDMHGNLRNFDKLQRFCSLDKSPGRCVILHELIHQEITTPGQFDTSIDLLVRAAAWKCDFPDNVFFLQSNHELAQLRGQEITKGGRSVLLDFEQGVTARYGRAAADVLDAARAYMASLPLAARTASGIFMAHSLPDPMVIRSFDIRVFDRIPDEVDLAPGGAAYSLVWGRFHTPHEVDAFAQRLGVEWFIVGHTPQEIGYNIIGRLMIVASDHNHGVFLPVDLGRRYTMEQLERSLRKFVSVE